MAMLAEVLALLDMGVLIGTVHEAAKVVDS